MAKAKDIKKQKPIESEIATTGKDPDIFYGWINALINPDPVLQNESGGLGVKLYDEIARDAHAGSVLQTLYLSVIGKEWEVVPAGADKKKKHTGNWETREKKIARFVEDALGKCNFDQMRLELLQAYLYGYYGAEVMWKTDHNGDVIIDRFFGKHPRRLSFTLDREPRLLTIQNMIEGEPLPDRKFLIFTYGDSDNPYGKGLGQKLWFPLWFKKHGVKFWVIFLEKFGMPTIVGKFPASKKGERAKLLEAIAAIQSETGVVIPEDMALEFLEAARSGKVSYGEMCEYMDRQISKAVLGQNLTTDISEKGSYSAAQVHEDVMQLIVEAVADLLDAYLNKTLIRWLVDYNFSGVTEYPRFVTQAGKKPDLESLSKVHKTVGIDMGLPITHAFLYETYNIPEPEEGEEVIERPALQAMLPASQEDEDGDDDGNTPARGKPKPGDKQQPNQKPKTKGKDPAFAEGDDPKYPPEQMAIEALVDKSAKQAVSVFSEMLKPVRKIIMEAESLQDAKDKIFAEYEHMDPQELEDLLAKALFTAHMHGRATIADDTAA